MLFIVFESEIDLYLDLLLPKIVTKLAERESNLKLFTRDLGGQSGEDYATEIREWIQKSTPNSTILATNVFHQGEGVFKEQPHLGIHPTLLIHVGYRENIKEKMSLLEALKTSPPEDILSHNLSNDVRMEDTVNFIVSILLNAKIIRESEV